MRLIRFIYGFMINIFGYDLLRLMFTSVVVAFLLYLLYKLLEEYL